MALIVAVMMELPGRHTINRFSPQGVLLSLVSLIVRHRRVSPLRAGSHVWVQLPFRRRCVPYDNDKDTFLSLNCHGLFQRNI